MVVVAGGCFGGEVCDDEVDNDGDGLVDCRDPASSLFPECTSCGDGLLDDAEACDDGDRDDNDDCSSRCELSASHQLREARVFCVNRRWSISISA